MDLGTLDISHLDADTRRAMYLRTVEPLWRRGNLRFLLDETQLRILDKLDNAKARKFFLLCSRRLGKSYTLVVLAFSMCLRKPGARVLYLAPFGKDASDIVFDIAASILDTCPEDLKPSYNAQTREYRFSNGSVIRFRGVNGEHAQFLRGGAIDLGILDECGIMDDLAHVVSDIVMPMTLTTGGRILLATTPPRTPGHDSATIYENLAGEGATVKFTILDNIRVSNEIKAEFLKEAGENALDIPNILSGLGRAKSTTALREYFCEFVTDASMAVLPEFSEHKAKIVKESERPAYFDAYVSMDPGMRDRTGILYGYWDFRRGKLVVEDESLLQRPSTLAIANEITEKEYRIWGDKAPTLRVSDVDLRLQTDLWERHRLKFIQAEKQDSLGAINLVRNMIQIGELEINPRCVHLIRQCENAIWNNKATDFARAGEQSLDGHFDLVASLKYMCRHIARRKNPFPNGWGVGAGNADSYQSPKRRTMSDRKKLGLMTDTPTSRRMLGLAPKKTQTEYQWSPKNRLA